MYEVLEMEVSCFGKKQITYLSPELLISDSPKHAMIPARVPAPDPYFLVFYIDTFHLIPRDGKQLLNY